MSYDWTFGDGGSATGSTAVIEHEFPGAGSYIVTLMVTDDEGATAVTTQQVVLDDGPLPPVTPEWRVASASDSHTISPVVFIPASVQPADRLVLFVTTNRAATLTTPTGWTLLGTVSDGTDMRSWALTRAAGPAIAGTSLQLALDAPSKVSLVLTAYSGAGAPTAWTSRAEPGSTSTHTAPAAVVTQDAYRVVRYYADKTSTVHTWTLAPTLVALGDDLRQRGGLLVAVAGDEGNVPAGTVPALAATAGVSASKALAWTLVLPPA